MPTISAPAAPYMATSESASPIDLAAYSSASCLNAGSAALKVPTPSTEWPARGKPLATASTAAGWSGS
eukprot:2280075-Prymnesium_polylepis.1